MDHNEFTNVSSGKIKVVPGLVVVPLHLHLLRNHLIPVDSEGERKTILIP